MMGKDRFGLKREPVYGIIVVVLFALGVVLLPGEDIGKLMLSSSGTDARNLGNAIFRTVGFILLVLLALDMGLDIFSFKGRNKGFLLSLPFLIVAVNNAPIAAAALGEVSISASAGSFVIFAFYCVSVGLFEETVFRGIVFPLVLAKAKKTRAGTFWSVVISSAIFGGIHLVNLISSAPLPVLAQVGYSFLIGAMCAAIMLLTRNIFACAFIHALYDFCGLMADHLGSGMVWSAPSIILTAAVGAAAAVYWAILMRKCKWTLMP